MPSQRTTISRRGLFRAAMGVLAAGLAGCAGAPAGDTAAPRVSEVRLPATGWRAERTATHLLNRLAFGPSAADLAEVGRLGAEGWLARQLRPESIPDSAVEARLKTLPTLTMTAAELHAAYPRPAQGKEADPEHSPRAVGRELVAQKLMRAVESRRQLQEVLTDFWFNHFNVDIRKGQEPWLVTGYERDVIRPRVLGLFRDLLGATASSPAMLFYLDNWTSAKEGFAARRPNGPHGLNENYARELLELHTLGVDGGYTQRDVREVARCFTGWSLDRPREGARFAYRDAMHDQGTKVVLGVTIPAGGGREDGEKVLDILARHPSTARFIATKLCRRFVADDPPPALVERVAAVFRRTDGDLRAVTAAVLTSPELWSDAVFAAKTKSPLELAASAVRALDGRIDDVRLLAGSIGKMGEPLYQCQPPTGYAESAAAWTAGGTLLTRMQFGEALAAGRLRGVSVRTPALAAGAAGRDALVARLSSALLGGPPSEPTRRAIAGAVPPSASGPPAAATVAGLLLGSPDFQRR